jgi:hypothetical protein
MRASHQFVSIAGAAVGVGCDASCTKSHGSDGNCLKCGKAWGPHNGHNCPSGGGRGSWPVAGVVAAGIHSGKMKCSCGHSMGLLSFPLDASYVHLKGSCKWQCCSQSYEISTCTAASSAVSSAGSHAGEWRDQKVTANYCAVDESCFGKGSTKLCVHPAGIVQDDHWSCCGLKSKSAACTSTATASAAFAVGQCVRVRLSVDKPKYGWGGNISHRYVTLNVPGARCIS